VLNRSKATFFSACVLSVLFLLVQSSFTQQRMSDRDIENIMKNLKNDSKRFESSFNSAISKSTIRNTSQDMLNIFQDKRTADTTLPGVLGLVPQIDALFVDVHLGGSAKSDWKKCKAELAILAEQFNMPMPKP
jgi:hypothetical protein